MQQLSPNSLLKGGTYKIEKVLGQGSFGITYLAKHTVLDKKVAIKEFFMKELNGRDEDGSITGMSDGSLSMDYARKFQKEAHNLAQLEHPNIVRITDLFEDNGTFYYVMDFIEGENLNEFVKHHQVSRQEAIEIIRDVAQALIYMHEEKHMLHLDLKPSNIMRRISDGHIFLIDFGLSKHYSSNGQPETSTTIGLGTVGYAPVEQNNQAKNGEFRPTIDIYALGATLYKLLTYETPPAASEFVSDDVLLTETFQKHNVEGEIADIVTKAMAPSAKKRLQSVREFFDMTTIMIEKKNQLNEHEISEETLVDEELNTEEESKSKKGVLIIAFLLIAAIVGSIMYFQTSTSDTNVEGIDTLTVNSDADTTMKEEQAKPQKDKKIENSAPQNSAKPSQAGSTEPSKKENKKDNSAAEKTKDVDKANMLKRALASGDYQTVQKLANQGYAAAYGPLAKYYLKNNEYSAAETYAKKAKKAGYREGKSVLNTLENLGYYD